MNKRFIVQRLIALEKHLLAQAKRTFEEKAIKKVLVSAVNHVSRSEMLNQETLAIALDYAEPEMTFVETFLYGKEAWHTVVGVAASAVMDLFRSEQVRDGERHPDGFPYIDHLAVARNQVGGIYSVDDL